MLKVGNAFLVMTVLISAFFLYSLEHGTRGIERQIVKLKTGISDEREAIKLLNAEWSSLTRPDRLQHLAEEQLKLQPMKAGQVVTYADLANRIPAAAPVQLPSDGSDPIGSILEKMQ